MSFTLHSDPEHYAEPAPSGAEIRRSGLEQLQDCLQALSAIPDAVKGETGLYCRFCGDAITSHFGRRAEKHFYRHPRNWCDLAGRTWWGDTNPEARALINL